MAYQITLMPGGRRFEAIRAETLLEAALRSGISLNYSCSSGHCGDCKARLLEGRLSQVDAHEYGLSSLESAQGVHLLCRAHAGSDLMLEADYARGVDDIPQQQVEARISKLQRLGETRLLLHLRTPRTRTLRFLAGQHVQLTIPGGPMMDLPIASCPCNGMVLQFHLSRDMDVDFVRHLFDQARPGDVMQIEGPFGEFTLDEGSDRPILMMAVGDFFAPLKSLMEHAVNLDLPQPVRLVWMAHDAEGHYLENHCRAWRDALDDYEFYPLVTDDLDAGVAAHLAAVQDPAGTDVYIAAHPSRLDALEAQLLVRGFEPSHIHLARCRMWERGDCRVSSPAPAVAPLRRCFSRPDPSP